MTAEATPLTVTCADGVAWLRLNRPDRRNALNDTLVAALGDALDAVARDDAIRAVVLAGAGRHFCAGADLAWMQHLAASGPSANLADATALAEVLHRLDTLDRPTLARVQGAATGGGLGLAACCDLVVAAESAVFALSEVKLGLIPAVIAPYVVTALGPRAARSYALTGERFDVATAQRLGLVHTVEPDSDLDTRVQVLLAELLGNGPEALAEVKRLIRDVTGAPRDAALRDETARRNADRRCSAEAREGIAAFLEKRRPGWAQ